MFLNQEAVFTQRYMFDKFDKYNCSYRLQHIGHNLRQNNDSIVRIFLTTDWIVVSMHCDPFNHISSGSRGLRSSPRAERQWRHLGLSGSHPRKQTLLAAAAMTLSTDTQRASVCLERPFVGRRLSTAAAVVVVVVACWSVSSSSSNGDRRWPVCRRGDVASVRRQRIPRLEIFGPGRRVPKSYSSCSCCCWNQFSKGPKMPKTFLIRSGGQQNFAYTFVLTLPTDLPSQIFHL